MLCQYNVDTLNIRMKAFGSEKIIFDKMTAVRTWTIFPNKAFVYAWIVLSWMEQFDNLSIQCRYIKQMHEGVGLEIYF